MDLSFAALSTLALAVTIGSAVQAATGFGFAILAAPVFLAVLQSTATVPILVALHVVQCLILVPKIWSGIPWPEFNRLAIGALFGCPAGLLLFRMLDVRQLKLGVGLVILLVTALLAWRQFRSSRVTASLIKAEPRRGTAITRVVTGGFSGVLTAVLVMPGPPLMVNLLRDPLPAASARALSIGFFAACYVAVLAVHLASGELDAAAGSIVGWLALPVLLGTVGGLLGSRWLQDRHYAPIMTALLLAAGLGAILSAL
ncbi:MAG: sulfite exporter TauE/SafE family protein [Hyphomicrobiaceae bacterium]